MRVKFPKLTQNVDHFPNPMGPGPCTKKDSDSPVFPKLTQNIDKFPNPMGPGPCTKKYSDSPVFLFVKKSFDKALDLHGAEGEETLGHLFLRALRHAETFRQQRSGTLGERHPGGGNHAALPAGVAEFPVQVRESGSLFFYL